MGISSLFCSASERLFSRERRHAAAYVLERLSNLGVTFLSGIIVLRALGPASFAIYGMTISVAQACSTAARLSLDEHFAFAYLRRGAPGRLATTLIGQRAIIGVGLALLALLFGSSFNVRGFWPALTVCVFCFLEAFSVSEIQVQALSRFRLLSTLGLVRSVTGLLLRAALLISGRGSLQALLAVALLELAIFRIGLFLAQQRGPILKSNDAEWGPGDLRGFFAPRRLRGYFATTVLSIAYTKTELFFAAAGLEKQALGTYLAAQRFVEAYAYLGNVFGALLLGPIARLADDAAARFTARATLKLAGVAVAFSILNVTVVPLLLPHLVGNKYAELPATFAVLSLNVIPLYVGTPTGKALLARGKTRLMVAGGILSVAICVAGFLFVLPATLGSLRPAIALVAGNSVGCAFILLSASRALRQAPVPAIPEDLLIVLPRRRSTGLNSVMELLADQLKAKVLYLDDGEGYSLRRLTSIAHSLRILKLRGTQVHSSGFVPDVLNAISGTRRTSTTVHNFLAPDYILQYGAAKGYLLTLAHFAALWRIPVRLGCSESVAKHARSVYRLHTITCVNGCRGPARLAMEVREHSHAQRHYFFAGPFIARKRVAETLATIARLDPAAVIQAFGSGPEDRLIDKMKESNRNLSSGPVANPMEHYRGGDFYVSFSSYEGLPLAVLEALRCGCIPVLSSIPPHEEILSLIHVDGLRCFANAEEGMYWAIGLTAAERVALAHKIHERANAVFSEATFADRFVRSLSAA